MHDILKRLEDGYSEVQRVGEHEKIVCIGGGPSLDAEQIAMVREARCRVIAINDAYLMAPFADVNYFCDAEWYGWHSKGVAKPLLGLTAEDLRTRFAAFEGQRCSIEITGETKDSSVHLLRRQSHEGISSRPTHLCTGHHSGYQVLNLAILARPALVILLGYDAREPRPGQQTHWHGWHPRAEPTIVYANHRKSFEMGANAIKATGVKVVNCSPGSLIETFPRIPLDLAL
jgi:hypothetical protein